MSALTSPPLQRLKSAAKRYPTPFFAWDTELLCARIRRVRMAFSRLSRFRLLYSIKANPSPLILQAIHGNQVGVDICSVGELDQVVKAGFPPEAIYALSIAPSQAELQQFLNSGCHVDLDSIDDMELWAGLPLRKRQIGLRVNPDVTAGYHKNFSAGTWDARFGVPLPELATALTRARDLDLTVAGLHIHVGSSGYDAAPYLEGVKKTLATSRSLGLQLDFLNIGGGWGIPFSTLDDSHANERFPLEEFATELRRLLEYYGYGNIELRAEPGEFLVGPCGYLCCAVRRIVTRRKGEKICRIAIVDGGMHLHPGAAQYEIDNFVLLLNREENRSSHQLLAGRTMQAGDRLGPARRMPHLEPGDIIALGAVGAYSWTHMHRFNSLPLAKEVAL